MSLLFDQNLSWRLVRQLADIYPGSAHIRTLGLEHEPDDRIWARARADGLAIVSKDDDFRQRALVFGAPPKTIWVRLGNCSTAVVEDVLRRRLAEVRQFLAAAEESILILQGPA